jgi:hypothetical protein
MKLAGKYWKSKTSKFWLVQIPLLDLTTQAKTQKDIPSMVKDAIESLIADNSFTVNVTIGDASICIEANNQKKLIALILKSQRQKKN